MELTALSCTPTPKLIGLVTWQSLKAYQRAGTVILVVSLIVWLLSIIPYRRNQHQHTSNYRKNGLEPVGSLMGMGWQMIVALIYQLHSRKIHCSLGVLTSGQNLGLTEQLHYTADTRGGPGLPGYPGAVHPLRSHGIGHQAGNQRLALGRFYHPGTTGFVVLDRDWVYQGAHLFI